MILDASTSLLPTSRCPISSGVRLVVIALFVPHFKTRCTSAMRTSSGTMLKAMILSSLNKLSVRTYRPDMRTMMIASAKPVHHHESNSVGLLATASLASGAAKCQSSIATSTRLWRGASVGRKLRACSLGRHSTSLSISHLLTVARTHELCC